MNDTINEKVSVEMTYNRETGAVFPRRMKWQGRLYTMQKLGYYHKTRSGRTVVHVFHVTDGTTDFRLSLNADNLHWTLHEIIDGTSA